jgi:hypothetical protein
MSYRRKHNLDVYELKKAKLHYAVALALGIKPVESEEELAKLKNAVFSDGESTIAVFKGKPLEFDWPLAGKLLQQEKIDLSWLYHCRASIVRKDLKLTQTDQYAKNAIFKVYVELKLGRKVIVPIE